MGPYPCEFTRQAERDALAPRRDMVREQHSNSWWEEVLRCYEGTSVGPGLDLADHATVMTHSRAGLRWQDYPMNLTLVHQRQQRPSLNPPSSSSSCLPSFRKKWPIPHHPLSFSLLPQASDHATGTSSRLCLQPFSLWRFSLSCHLHS